MTARVTKPWGADRPLTTVVALDPALTGPCGLAVARLDQPEVAPRWYQGQALDPTTFRWLGDQVSELTPAGHRAVLVAESNAFGPSVGRKLGIAVGAIEGLLVDLNATVVGTRIDVATATWRSILNTKARGRRDLKRAAVQYALRRWPLGELPEDAAEAVCILEWARTGLTYLAVL